MKSNQKPVNSNLEKDGLILQRARRAIGASEVYTLKTVHISHNGACLCGFKGQLYKDTNLDIAKMPKCARCHNKLDALLADQVRIENRNYWLKPEHGGVKLEPKRAKSIPKYTQDMLPSEYLPTGTGQLLREVAPTHAKEY